MDKLPLSIHNDHKLINTTDTQPLYSKSIDADDYKQMGSKKILHSDLSLRSAITSTGEYPQIHFQLQPYAGVETRTTLVILARSGIESYSNLLIGVGYKRLVKHS